MHRVVEESISHCSAEKAKDTVTRRTVMILVSDHTFTPPHRDPICIQPALPASTSSISSSFLQQQPQWRAKAQEPQTWPVLFIAWDPDDSLSPAAGRCNVFGLPYLLTHLELIYIMNHL